MKRKAQQSGQKAKRQKALRVCSCPHGGEAEYGTYEMPFTHCAKCKQPDMTIKKSGKHYCQCSPSKQVTFGYKGGRPTRCRNCKTKEMVDVVNQHCPCGHQPSFGKPGGRPTHCTRCKEEGMVDVRNRHCPCGVQPIFGKPGGRPTHCARCRKDGMVNLIHRQCGCGVQPIFGYPGGPRTHCARCKKDGMVNLINRQCGCGVQRSFGLPGGRPTHCAKCRLKDMVNLVSKRCVVCDETFAQKDGFCVRCHPLYVAAAKNVSKIGCQWIDELQREFGQPIKHGHYHGGKLEGKEFRPPCMPRHPVDGYINTLDIRNLVQKINPQLGAFAAGEKGVILEMLGDIWHGHKRLWPKVKNHKGFEFQSLYQNTKEKMELLTGDGYLVMYIWESEYRKYLKSSLGDLYSYCQIYDGQELC